MRDYYILLASQREAEAWDEKGEHAFTVKVHAGPD